MKKNIKEYGMILLRAIGIFFLYAYVMIVTDENAADMLARLNLHDKDAWMFLVIEIVAMYVGIAVLWHLVLQRSALRKRHLAGRLPSELSYKDGVRDTLAFRYFWLESLSILLPCAYLSPVRENVIEMLGIKTDLVIVQYILSLVLFTLPMLLLFLHIEVQLRREWAEEWFLLDEGVLRRFREGIVHEKKYYVKLTVNVLLYLFGMLMLPSMLFYVMAALNAFKAFLTILPQLIAIFVTVGILWFIIRLWRSYRRRRRFIKEMQAVCDKRKFKFTYQFTFKGLITCTGKTEFTVKTQDKTYYGCLLPVPGRTSRLYFSPHTDVYRFGMWGFHAYFPKHILDLSGMSPMGEGSQRVVVLTRRPTVWRLGNKKGGYHLDNGSSLSSKSGKAALYDLSGFVSLVDLTGICRDRKVWQ